jgi:hypothetical protein
VATSKFRNYTLEVVNLVQCTHHVPLRDAGAFDSGSVREASFLVLVVRLKLSPIRTLT